MWLLLFLALAEELVTFKKGAGRRTAGLTRENFGKMIARVCPADASFDAEMERLLQRMGGAPEKNK
jgi:hypothetical protein